MFLLGWCNLVIKHYDITISPIINHYYPLKSHIPSHFEKPPQQSLFGCDSLAINQAALSPPDRQGLALRFPVWEWRLKSGAIVGLSLLQGCGVIKRRAADIRVFWFEYLLHFAFKKNKKALVSWWTDWCKVEGTVGRNYLVCVLLQILVRDQDFENGLWTEACRTMG